MDKKKPVEFKSDNLRVPQLSLYQKAQIVALVRSLPVSRQQASREFVAQTKDME